MKKIRLFFALIIFSSAGFAQECPDVILGTIVTTAPGQYELMASFIGTGVNHVVDSIYCGTTLISTECIEVDGPGMVTRSFSCTDGLPSAILNVGIGVCGSNTLCNRIFICTSCGPLPVKLSEFTGQRKSNDVLLDWKTESEVNSSHFEIYRSFDNIKYERIGNVSSATSNSNLVHNYNFNDNSNFSGSVSYYKLKIVDRDGRFEYSNIITVKGSGIANAGFIIFPNPATSNSKITISGISEPTQVRVIDNSGRILRSVVLTSNLMDISGLQRGNYILMIQGKTTGQSVVRKLTVVN